MLLSPCSSWLFLLLVNLYIKTTFPISLHFLKEDKHVERDLSVVLSFRSAETVKDLPLFALEEQRPLTVFLPLSDSADFHTNVTLWITNVKILEAFTGIINIHVSGCSLDDDRL